MKFLSIIVATLILSGCVHGQYNNQYSQLSSQANIEKASWDRAYAAIEEKCYGRKLPSMKMYDCTQGIFDQTVIPTYPDLYKQWASSQRRIFVDRDAGKITSNQADAYLADLADEYFAAANQRADGQLKATAINDYARASAMSDALNGAAASQNAWTHQEPSAAIKYAPRSTVTNCYSLGASVQCTTQ